MAKWTADEDTFRQLSRFRLFQLHSYPDGVIWAAGENLLRFAPKTDTASSKSFPNLIRQVNVRGFWWNQHSRKFGASSSGWK